MSVSDNLGKGACRIRDAEEAFNVSAKTRMHVPVVTAGQALARHLYMEHFKYMVPNSSRVFYTSKLCCYGEGPCLESVPACLGKKSLLTFRRKAFLALWLCDASLCGC